MTPVRNARSGTPRLTAPSLAAPSLAAPDLTAPDLAAPDQRVPGSGPLASARAVGVPAWQSRQVRGLMLGDGALVGLAGLIALAVRFPGEAPVGYVVATITFPFLWLMFAVSTRAYEPRFLGTGSEEFRRLSDAAVRLLAAMALVAFALRLDIARFYILIAWPTALGLTVVHHYVARQRLHRRRARGLSQHSVIVVGRERACAELIRQFRSQPYAGFQVVGACIDRIESDAVEGLPVLGTSSDVVAALARTGADTVAVGAWSDYSSTGLRQLSWDLEGSHVSLVVAPSLTDIAGPRIHIRPVAGLPLLHVEQPEFIGGRRVLKGAFDRLSALAVLAVVGLPLLVLAALVRLTSRGPAFFRQTRIGIDGSQFTMLKLRSMYDDSEARLEELQEANERADGLLFKIRQDPRVTRLGAFLRRFSLDELPQLWNIVRGDMSVVGPRPPLPREVEQYAISVHRRLLVKPGLTGLWQVSGRSDLTWEESVRLDLHYVENWSLALDLLIIWKTFSAVLKRDGAY